jgi:hypothetical protein
MNSSGFNMSNLNLSSLNLSSLDLSKLNLSSIFNKTNTTNTTNTTDTNDTTVTPVEPAKEDSPQIIDNTDKTPVNVVKHNQKSYPSKLTKTPQAVAKLYTIKRANDSTVLYQGDSIVTLDELDKIFGSSFTEGRLVLYIDGEVVFNETVNGDLAAQIFEIVEKFLGQHDLKVEFTDNSNNTNTFEENVIIE